VTRYPPPRFPPFYARRAPVASARDSAFRLGDAFNSSPRAASLPMSAASSNCVQPMRCPPGRQAIPRTPGGHPSVFPVAKIFQDSDRHFELPVSLTTVPAHLFKLAQQRAQPGLNTRFPSRLASGPWYRAWLEHSSAFQAWHCVKWLPAIESKLVL